MTADAEPTTARMEARTLPGKTYWDSVGETTRWGRYLSEVEKQVILKATALAGAPGKAVDMGCGGGRWSKLLHERGWELTCTDVSSHSLAICRRNLPTATCLLAKPTTRAIPCENAAAKLVLCIEVAPLIEASWFPAETHRVLEPGGLFVGVYINARSWRALAWRVKNRLSASRTSEQYYTSPYPDWREQLLDTGFEMVHEESCCWGPFSRESNSPFVPAAVKLERALGLHRVVSWSPWVVFIARKVK